MARKAVTSSIRRRRLRREAAAQADEPSERKDDAPAEQVQPQEDRRAT